MKPKFFLPFRMIRSCLPALLALLLIFIANCGGGGGGGYGDIEVLFLFGIAVEDLNNDTVPDIAVASWADDCVIVILNDADSPGDFLRARKYEVGTKTFLNYLAAGDLNGDGFSDIVTENGENVFVLFQDSSSPGDFLKPVEIAVGNSGRLAIGDLNHDGFNDIAVAHYATTPLLVLFQDSGNPGHFLPPAGLGIGAGSAVIGDLNGDDMNDIAFADPNFGLLFQDPDDAGHFLGPVELDAGADPDDVKIGDLDNDGNPDLVVGRGDFGGSKKGGVSILLQDPGSAGDFLPAVTYDLQCNEVREVSLGDLNDDGFLDIAVLTWCSEIALFLQDLSAVGTFLRERVYSTVEDPWSLAIGDLNGDDLNDLVFSEEDNVVARFQDPLNPGTFSRRVIVFDLDW